MNTGHGKPRNAAGAAADWARLAIAPDTLERLIASGALCAAEIRCLDGAAKQLVQQLCLQRCAKCLHVGDPAPGCRARVWMAPLPVARRR